MGMQISGIATVPNYYRAENGMWVQIRPEDVQSAISNSEGVPFQVSHETLADPKGDAFALRMNSKGGMYYGASIDDVYTEETIKTIFDEGKIPNVSPKLVPLDTAEFEEHTNDDGELYLTASEWKLEHIALVETGRCTPEQGCGIFDYQVLNSSKGDSMAEDANKVSREDIALELSELKDTVTAKDTEISKLKSSVEELELALSEANNTINKFEEAKLDEKRNAILQLDDSIEAEELKEVKDSKALDLMLSGLRDRTSRKAKAKEQENSETSFDVINEFKRAAKGL